MNVYYMEEERFARQGQAERPTLGGVAGQSPTQKKGYLIVGLSQGKVYIILVLCISEREGSRWAALSPGGHVA